MASSVELQSSTPPTHRSWRRGLLIALATMALMVGWTAFVLAGTLGGWWRTPLAPHGDSQAFLAATGELFAKEQRGNVEMVLIQNSRIIGEQNASIGRPVNRDTLFQIASISKWITALGVMTLVDAGKVDLDAPIETYVKRWKLPASQFDNRQVTVRRLLSHTAGLTDGLGYGGFTEDQKVQTLAESLTHAADAAPGQTGVTKVGMQPGTEWAYSGGGYTLLQMMIEDVTGEPFDAYMRRAVLQPLGMTHSFFGLPAEGTPNVAETFDAKGKSIPFRRYTATGAASLFTSATDLARLIAIHRAGPDGAPGRGVLRPETLVLMRKPHARAFASDIWGLGVVLFGPNNSGGFIIGHDGGNYPTINTTVRFDPATGDGIVALASGEPPMADRLGSEWVFWRTGTVDKVTALNEAPQMLKIMGAGWLVILIAGIVIGWRGRKRHRNAAAA